QLSNEDPPEAPRQLGGGRRPPVIRATGENDYQIKKTGGFRTLGEMAIAVRKASIPGGGAWIDPRLDQLNQSSSLAPTTFANEGSGAEGGFAVPADFRTAIMEKVLGEASLLSRTDQITVSGNTLTIPKDNGTPWGTTGIRAYWGNEGGLKTQSRPAFDSMTLRLHKVYSLVPVTDELAEDAPAMDSYLRRKAPEAIDFAINLAIVQGSGSNQPLGILNSPATVSVAKETSQLADTIVANNIIKMWSRMYAPNRANAVWLVSQDIETQLYTMALPGKDNTGASIAGWGSHVFMPAGGLSGNPYSTLFGRPVIPTQACNELGDKGDIILWDPTSYLTALKSGANPKVDVSIHLWFDYDVTAYRFVLRMTGQPWWGEAITPRDGTNTLSPMVTLDERA
ncbi:MAG TPA: phage major capsid protein, partial [Planctomycetaceae bacterium]|nr:phage major capsid protein [Planctomycetaceae bacterium]